MVAKLFIACAQVSLGRQSLCQGWRALNSAQRRSRVELQLWQQQAGISCTALGAVPSQSPGGPCGSSGQQCPANTVTGTIPYGHIPLCQDPLLPCSPRGAAGRQVGAKGTRRQLFFITKTSQNAKDKDGQCCGTPGAGKGQTATIPASYC